MSTKRIWILLSVLSLYAAGCGSPSATVTSLPVATPIPSTQPEVTMTGSVTAKGKVVPALKARMGFLVAGLVKQLSVREGDSVTAGQILVSLNIPALEFSVIGAEAGVRSAQSEADYWIYPRKGQPGERQKLARDQLAFARTELDMARAELARTTLAAPFNGTVVALNATPGQYVRPGQVVVMIGDLSRLQIETTDLSERVVSALRVGQPASIFVRALDRQLAGSVIDIGRISATVGGDVVYKVILKLDEQPDGLLWGMSADVEIQTGN